MFIYDIVPNFADPDWIRAKYGLSKKILDGHNTNTGVVFWNNKAVVDFKIAEKSIKCFSECTSEKSNRMFLRGGDQALFALVSILDPPLPMLTLPRGYNYRIHNADDQKENIKEEDIRMYHFIGPKLWEPIPLKNSLMDPSLLLYRDKWFVFVREQRVFNRDLTIKSQRIFEKLSKAVSYWWADRVAAIIINCATLIKVLKSSIRIARFVLQRIMNCLR